MQAGDHSPHQHHGHLVSNKHFRKLERCWREPGQRRVGTSECPGARPPLPRHPGDSSVLLRWVGLGAIVTDQPRSTAVLRSLGEVKVEGLAKAQLSSFL
jgi:hypothetical protein